MHHRRVQAPETALSWAVGTWYSDFRVKPHIFGVDSCRLDSVFTPVSHYSGYEASRSVSHLRARRTGGPGSVLVIMSGLVEI